jgi:hypothetical protein
MSTPKINVLWRVAIAGRLALNAFYWHRRGYHAAAKVDWMAAWHVLRTGERFGGEEYKAYHHKRLERDRLRRANDPEHVGQEIINAIAAGSLMGVECPDAPGSACLVVWRENAAEQIGMLALNRK